MTHPTDPHTLRREAWIGALVGLSVAVETTNQGRLPAPIRAAALLEREAWHAYVGDPADEEGAL